MYNRLTSSKDDEGDLGVLTRNSDDPGKVRMASEGLCYKMIWGGKEDADKRSFDKTTSVDHLWRRMFLNSECWNI